MNLNEAQSLFKDGLLDPQAQNENYHALKPVGRLTLQEAFAVYHRSYLARLSDALGDTFEAVLWVLGDDLFRKTCRAYITAEPSSYYNLFDYGYGFPNFIKATLEAQEIPFLYDLARFEWLGKRLYHAPTPRPLSTEHLEELFHSGDFKLHFIEGLEIFECPYAIYDIWRHRKEPSYHFDDINWNHPEILLIYKKQKRIYVQRIDGVEAHILRRLKDGCSASRALAEFSGLLTPDRITALFHMMINNGIVEDVLILET